MLFAFWTSSALPSQFGRVAAVQGPGARLRRMVAEDAVGAGLVLRPGEHHEALARRDLVTGVGLAVRAERDERVVGLERDEDRAAALDGLVDAVVEELAEEGEDRVVRRREADVGGHVRDEEGLVRGDALSRVALRVHGGRAGRQHAAVGVQDRVGRARRRGRRCPACGRGTPRRRPRPGSSTSGRRSGC